MADGGEHLGAQRVDRLHLAKITDDPRWLLGQLLEDGPLKLGDGGQLQPTDQGQHHTALLAGLLDPHRGHPSASSSDKHLILALAPPKSSALHRREVPGPSSLPQVLIDRPVGDLEDMATGQGRGLRAGSREAVASAAMVCIWGPGLGWWLVRQLGLPS
jgi:hypothetical protein